METNADGQVSASLPKHELIHEQNKLNNRNKVKIAFVSITKLKQNN